MKQVVFYRSWDISCHQTDYVKSFNGRSFSICANKPSQQTLNKIAYMQHFGLVATC